MQMLDPVQCARNGNVDYFRTVDIDVIRTAKDSNKGSILAIAAQSGQLQCCQVIYKRCRELLYETSIQGVTALHCAAHLGHENTAKFLLYVHGKKEEDIESEAGEGSVDMKLLMAVNIFGNTALHDAVFQNHFRVAKLLVEADHSNKLLVMQNGNSYTVMNYAVEKHRIDFVKLFLGRDPTIDYPPFESGDFPILFAFKEATGGDPIAAEIRRFMIEKQPSRCRAPTTKSEWTLLHYATSAGEMDAIKEIMESCSDCLELLDRHGQNCLHLAAKIGRENVVKYFTGLTNVSEKALNQTDKNGDTPLHIAAREENDGLTKVLLFDHRVLKTIRNKEGKLAPALITFDYDKRRAKYGFTNVNEKELKDQSDFDLLVGALICTVSFTAGITVPGGYNSDGPNRGMAILYKRTSFETFIVLNTIAFVLSLYAVFSHYCTRHLNNEKYIIRHLHIASFCTLGSIFALMGAFISGSFAVLAVSTGLMITICGICFLFFAFAFEPMGRMIWQLRQRQLDSG